MISILTSLYQCRLLTIKGLWYSFCAIRNVGINLMALLYISQRFNPHKIAVQDENSQLSFRELYQQSQHLADQLDSHYGFKPKQKVAIIAYNHMNIAHTLFALSVLGLDIYLINAEVSAAQFAQLNQQIQFDLVIRDADIDFALPNQSIFMYHDQLPSIQSMLALPRVGNKSKRKIQSFSKIIVLTSGSTGRFKLASRNTNAKNFIAPFTALLTKLRLSHYSSIYIATPIYHGFGMATFCIAILLGATSFLRKKFTTHEASHVINEKQIEVVTLVPLMLNRLLKYDASALTSLKCIVTGGAPISSKLVNDTLTTLGNVLFNLYGTSEAGVCTIATPDDLTKLPNTIGLPIAGLKSRIMKQGQLVTNEVGELYIQCAWSIQGNQWIATGDLAIQNPQGYYFLQGRVDDRIISAGENVYPIDLEQQLLDHPLIAESYVMPISDEEFGQRLVAFVVSKNSQCLSEDALILWLKTNVARYQMPKKIVQVTEIPITAIGKPDKKRLLTMLGKP